MNVTIKRRVVDGVKMMGKKSINRAPTKKTVSCKETVTESSLTASKKKRVSVDLL